MLIISKSHLFAFLIFSTILSVFSSRLKSDTSGNLSFPCFSHFPFARSWGMRRKVKKLTLIESLLWSSLYVWTLYTLSHLILITTLSGSYCYFCHFRQDIKLRESRYCVQNLLRSDQFLRNVKKNGMWIAILTPMNKDICKNVVYNNGKVEAT